MTRERKQLLEAMRVYLGSVDYASLRDQEKLYNRALRLVEQIAEGFGLTSEYVWVQAEEAARKAGIIRPIPGQHI